MFFTGSRSRGSRIRDEGSLLPLRPELNFIGSSITAADNAAAGRTDRVKQVDAELARFQEAPPKKRTAKKPDTTEG